MNFTRKHFFVLIVVTTAFAVTACGEAVTQEQEQDRQQFAASEYYGTGSYSGPPCGDAHCRRGDLCSAWLYNTYRCKRVTECNGIYNAVAYGYGGGPTCGSRGSTILRCNQGDACASDFNGTCKKIWPCGCSAIYDAAEGGRGAYCGVDTSKGHTVYLKCEPGDACASRAGRQCRKARVCDESTYYHASENGAGVACGYEPLGHKVYLFCEPGSTCVNANSDLCRSKDEPEPPPPPGEECLIAAFGEIPGTNPAHKRIPHTTLAQCEAEAKTFFNAFFCGRLNQTGRIAYHEAWWNDNSFYTHICALK